MGRAIFFVSLGALTTAGWLYIAIAHGGCALVFALSTALAVAGIAKENAAHVRDPLTEETR